jgi:hypothetical protein
VARRTSLRFFLRLWLVSRGLQRSQWRWRRFLGMLYTLRTVRNFVVKRPAVHSVNVLTPGTTVFVSNIPTPTRRERRAAVRFADSVADSVAFAALPADNG